jgi:hypothetical protein
VEPAKGWGYFYYPGVPKAQARVSGLERHYFYVKERFLLDVHYTTKHVRCKVNFEKKAKDGVLEKASTLRWWRTVL